MSEKSFDSATVLARSNLYSEIRAYFLSESVLEVEVPTLGVGGATDPYLASFQCSEAGQSFYLQTSPEFFLKRLLCRGSGDVFTLCKSFRSGEAGARHNPEFTMLEWYRLGFQLQELIDDVLSLLRYTGVDLPVSTFSYGELFQQFVGVNPHQASTDELQNALARWDADLSAQLEHSAALDFLFTHAVESNLPAGCVVISDYPACQAALAKVQVDSNGDQVARRFELYINGMELANGYAELTDANEQAKRFEGDNQRRLQLGLPEVTADLSLVTALRKGMPECAGVAVGVDRLLMLLTGHSRIEECLLFPWRDL